MRYLCLSAAIFMMVGIHVNVVIFVREPYKRFLAQCCSFFMVDCEINFMERESRRTLV